MYVATCLDLYPSMGLFVWSHDLHSAAKCVDSYGESFSGVSGVVQFVNVMM